LSKITAETDAYNLFQLDPAWKTVLGVGCLTSLAFGSFWKLVIYQHFRKIKFWDRPINVLILMDVVIHHALYSVSLVMIGVWMLTATSAADFFVQVPILSKVTNICNLHILHFCYF
jgi:hypothetical protein